MSTSTSTDFASPSLPVELIDESPSNPRKLFGDLSELTASIKESGVLQPVLVRLVGERYELVYGHRRLRAAKEAGLDAIPANVTQMTPEEVLTAQIVENGQRADIHPLEEADGYHRLHTEHDLSVEEIAKKVGKSKASVYARMKLADLVDQTARAAFLKGKIPASIALLIARLPAELQEKAASEIITCGRSGDDSDVMSVREAQDYLYNDLGFDQDEKTGELVDVRAEREAAEKKAREARAAAKKADAEVRKARDAERSATTKTTGPKEDPIARALQQKIEEETRKAVLEEVGKAVVQEADKGLRWLAVDTIRSMGNARTEALKRRDINWQKPELGVKKLGPAGVVALIVETLLEEDSYYLPRLATKVKDFGVDLAKIQKEIAARHTKPTVPVKVEVRPSAKKAAPAKTAKPTTKPKVRAPKAVKKPAPKKAKKK